MAVRFDTGARRSIVAATIEAEKHGRPRPIPIDIVMGLMSLPESPVPTAVVGLGAEARALIATALALPERDGPGLRSQSPEDAERILRRAAGIAQSRGADTEITILDILTAALATTGMHASVGHSHGSANSEHATGSGALTPGRHRNEQHAAAGLQTRSGIGYDSHRFGDVAPLILGGVTIPESVRLVGHSDGDAVAHAITDALLGAAGAGDIGEMFSNTDPANRGRDSLQMLRAAVDRIASLGFSVQHVDATIIAEQPKISRYRDAMRAALSTALGISPDRVSVKGKTNEGMGWIGRGEGIACIAIATLATSSPS